MSASIRSNRFWFAGAGLCAALGAAALGQVVGVAPPNRIAVHRVVNPTQWANTFRPAIGEDSRIPGAKHPPFDQIPPMPMPTPNPLGPASIDTVTVVNTETGQITELPLGQPSGLEQGQGGIPFTGVDGNVMSETTTNSGFGTMVTANSLTTYPTRANCKLVMRYVDMSGADRFFACSGSMQDGGVVLTAAHCVYARDVTGSDIFDWAQEIWVYCGWDGNNNNGPFGGADTDEVINEWGWARGTGFMAGSDYINNGNTDRDCGAIRLNRAVTRSVGQLTGWYGWAWGGCDTGLFFYNYSFPSENCSASLHTGRQMYYWDGNFDSCPLFTNQYQISTGSGCLTALWGGQSGSGAYYLSSGSRYANAVASTSDRSSVGNYCKLWEQFTVDLGSFQDDTRGSTFDIEALQFRLDGSTTVRQGDSLPDGTVIICNSTNNNPASRSVTIRVHLSSNNNISSTDTVLATYNYTVDFGVNDCITFNVPGATIPYGSTTGTRFVGVEIDLAEDTNDSNNDTDTWDAQQITVNPCLLPGQATGVLASDATSCTTVTLTWTGVAGATSYEVWRNTVNNSATATEIATDTASPYVDSPPTTAIYYYWLKAIDGCGTGPFNASPGIGFRDSPPAAPTGVAATTDTSCTEVTVTWNAVSGATSYDVYRNTTNTSTGASLVGNNIAASPFHDIGAVAGTTYFYFLKSNNACGTSAAFSISDIGRRNSVPGAPTGLTASDSTNCAGVTVSWTATTNTTSYDLYRNTVNNSGTAVVISANLIVTSVTDGSAVAGTTYFYWVRAGNVCGDGGFSNADSGVRRGVPGGPTSIAATDGTVCTGVTVTWNAGADAATYDVLRNTTNTIIGATTLATGVAGLSFNDTSAVVGTTYFYFVRSVNPCGSTPGALGDSGFRGTTPIIPTGVNATDGTTCNSVVVSWTATAGATSYQIWRSTVNNSAFAAQIGTDTVSPFPDNTAAAGTTYFYFVKSVTSCAVSGFSLSNSGFAGTTANITGHPSDRIVPVGGSASFSVVAGGSNTYRWRKNGANMSNGGNISGALSATLTINPVGVSDAAIYDCVVTNTCGSIASDRARLSVRCPSDVDDGSGTGTPDGGVTIEDLIYYLAIFDVGLSGADLDDGSGTGTPDGGVTIEDLLYFLFRFDAGC